MQRWILLAALSLSASLLSSRADCETLAELVKKEEGVEFDACALAPKPGVAGKDVYAVVPARFSQPGIWVTRMLLLVGVDEAKNVQGVLELALRDDVPPREVVSVTCRGSTLTIRLPRKSLIYTWTGKELRRK